MKRLGGVWEQLVSFDNLHAAYRKARRGKRDRPAVRAFEWRLEAELLALQSALRSGRYRPGAYHIFTLYERKPRLIAAAPFRDRVVHHALLRVIEPSIDRRMITHSFACRRSKGVHAAVDYYQRQSQLYPYVLKLDIASYFPSIDHQRLKACVRRHIKDPQVLTLIDCLVDTSPVELGRVPCRFDGDDLLTPQERRCGLPIGNLTSQFLANLFLDRLDHQIKEQLGCGAYLRYVDDLMLLGRSKEQLHRWRDQIAALLADERLLLHPRKAHIYRTAAGIDCLGYQVSPRRRRLRADNGFRFRRRLRQFARDYAERRADWGDFNPSVQSWIGHARHADTQGLMTRLFSETVFIRA